MPNPNPDPALAIAERIAETIFGRDPLAEDVRAIAAEIRPLVEALRIGAAMSNVLFNVKQTNADERLRQTAERLQKKWDEAVRKVNAAARSKSKSKEASQ